uniref:uncharacterized protein LOC122589608 n=1 Tax=Erigeron canadensis TaxID=72917 RepID=UPI001CB95A69|nr:uncharacterized protein LOC122589608 [Erigeron canadensis]
MANNNNTVRLLRLIRAKTTSLTPSTPLPHSTTRYRYEPLKTNFQSSSLLSRGWTPPSFGYRKLPPLTHRYFHTSNAYTSGKSEPFKRLITGFNSSSSLVSRGYTHQLNTNWKLLVQRYRNMLKSCNLGYEFSMWRILGVSAVLGSFFIPPRFALCMDEGDAGSVDDHSSALYESETMDDFLYKLKVFARRLVVPIGLFLIVWRNWNFPVALAVKVIFTFLSTKPNPLSVYLFIEQLQQQYGRRHFFLQKLKPSYAKTVEAKDYMAFSIAKVKIGDREYTLLGILGGWWAFGLLSFPFSDLQDMELPAISPANYLSDIWSHLVENVLVVE